MISDLLEQLKKDEGRVVENGRHVVYDDHLGFATLGYGRLVDRRRGGGIDESEADLLLTNDVNRIIHRLSQEPWWPTLSEPRRAVLVMMAFQLGITGMFSFQKMLASIRRRDYGAAAAEMLDSQWARQTPARARRLSVQMDSGHWQR